MMVSHIVTQEVAKLASGRTGDFKGLYDSARARESTLRWLFEFHTDSSSPSMSRSAVTVPVLTVASGEPSMLELEICGLMRTQGLAQSVVYSRTLNYY